MGLNFLGLGFSLGAQDKGLAGAIKETSSGLADISKSVVGIGLASAKMIFKPPNFGPAIALTQQLANDVKLTTTNMEAYGVAAEKVTSEGLAGLNLSEKALNKAKGQIAGIAFSMNVPVENVTKSFEALTQAGIDVNDMAAYGFKNFKQFNQLMEVTGANGADVASAMGTMNKQMGMSQKQIKGTVQSVAAIGKSMNIGKQAISGMASTVKILNENSNLLPHAWSPARMDKFIKGTTIVSGALTGIGMKADDAMAASQELTKALLKGQKNISSLYSGLTDDLGVPMEVLTQNLGTVDEAWKMMQESPDQFMLKMGKLVSQVKGKLKPEAFDRFRIQMEGAFGPQVMAAFQHQGFGQLEPMIEKANKAMNDGGKAIDSMAKKHRDGRTYAERFAIAQDMIQTRLKKVKGVMGDGVYLKEYVKQGKEFTDWANATAAKGGPLGKLTTALIEVKNRGFGGFLASHSKFGFAMAEGIKMMEPLMQYLPALKVAFMALMSPIGMVVAAVAGLYFAFKDLQKGSDSVLRPFLNKIVEEAPKFIAKVGEIAGQIFDAVWKVLGSVDWAGVMTTVGDAFTKIFNSIFDVIDKIDWNKVGQVLGIMLSKAAEVAVMALKAAVRLGERILNWLDSVDWGGVGKKAGHYFAMIGEVVLGAIVKVISNLPQILVKIFKHAADFIIGALDSIKNYLVKKFPSAAKPIEFIFDVLKGIVKIVSGVLQFAFKAIGKVVGVIWSAIKGVASVIGWIAGKVGGALSTAFGWIKDAVGWIWDKLKAAASVVGKVVGAIGGALGKVGSFFKSVGSGIAGVFSGSSAERDKFLKETYEKNLQAVRDHMALAKKRHDEWVKNEHSAGRATAGYVKTVEGEIIKAVDSFKRYEYDALGVIREVAHETAKFTKVAVRGESWEAMDEFRQKSEALSAKHLKGLKMGTDAYGEASAKVFEETGKLMEEFTDKYGVSYTSMLDMQEKLSLAFGKQSKIVEEAKTAGVGYHAALVDLQESLTKNLGEVALKMEQVRHKQGENSEDFKKLQQQYAQLNADGNRQVEQYATLMSGHVDKFLDASTRGVKDQMAALEKAGKQGTDAYVNLSNQLAETNKTNAELTAHVLATAFKAQTQDMLKNIPAAAGQAAEEIKKKYGDRVTEMMNQIGEMQKKEQQALIAEGKVTGEELNKQLKAIGDTYQKKAEEIRKITVDNSKLISMGTADGANKALDQLGKGLDEMKKKVDVKTKEAATEIQKQFGISGEAALESVNQIAAIDPKTFRTNIGVVKREFMSFIAQMDKDAKKILENTTKSFNKLWDTLDGGFKKTKGLMEDFGKAADAVLTTFWNSVIDKATKAATQIVDITKGIGVSLKTMARSINLMDLLASPDQITQWAAAVVSALASAFRTGSAADAMISASYNKALQMAGEIQKNAGSATPDTAPAKSSASSSAITAAQELLRTMNHPAWATDKKELIPSELAKMNENLKTLIEATNALAAGRATSPRGPKAPGAKR
jgi:phage-related protein